MKKWYNGTLKERDRVICIKGFKHQIDKDVVLPISVGITFRIEDGCTELYFLDEIGRRDSGGSRWWSILYDFLSRPPMPSVEWWNEHFALCIGDE